MRTKQKLQQCPWLFSKFSSVIGNAFIFNPWTSSVRRLKEQQWSAAKIKTEKCPDCKKSDPIEEKSTSSAVFILHLLNYIFFQFRLPDTSGLKNIPTFCKQLSLTRKNIKRFFFGKKSSFQHSLGCGLNSYKIFDFWSSDACIWKYVQMPFFRIRDQLSVPNKTGNWIWNLDSTHFSVYQLLFIKRSSFKKKF